MKLGDLPGLVFSISGLLLSLLVVCGWMLVRPASRAARAWLVAIVLAYSVVSIYPVPHGVGHLLSRGITPLERHDVPAGRTAVVLLGSGSFTEFDWSNGRAAVVDPPGLSRTLEAACVYRMLDPVCVIVSGGRIAPGRLEPPLGETMKALLVQLGVLEARIIVRDEAVDTHDEAVMVARLLPSLHVDHVVLVTSRSHIRRAAATFRASGVDVIPAPARDDGPMGLHWRTRFLPTSAGLQEASFVAHELLGLVYYTIRGWR